MCSWGISTKLVHYLIMEAVMTSPSTAKIKKKVAAELAWLSVRKLKPTIAAPVIMIARSPYRSISEPITGLLNPAASGAVATGNEKKARPQPKGCTTGKKD